jgi:uncharacterized protein (DUF1778 family)
MTPDDMELLRRAAILSGVSTSQFVRDIALITAEKMLLAAEKVLGEEQGVYWSHAGGESDGA